MVEVKPKSKNNFKYIEMVKKYLNGNTYAAVAKEYGYSGTRIRQLVRIYCARLLFLNPSLVDEATRETIIKNKYRHPQMLPILEKYEKFLKEKIATENK